MDERIAIYFTLGIDLYRIKSDLCPKVPNMDTKDESVKSQTAYQSKTRNYLSNILCSNL